MQPFDERYFLEVKDSAEFTGEPENAFKIKPGAVSDFPVHFI